ncbi:MAG: hypothetical protein QXY49_04010 [Thermofilaceae archaeon]
MSQIPRFITKILDPIILAPLIIAASLFLLCGVFNILYTMIHSPEEFIAVTSIIGPVASRSYQNFIELTISFVGYLMVVAGYYLLYTGSGKIRSETAKLSIATGLVLIIVGSLLVIVLYAQKTGG